MNTYSLDDAIELLCAYRDRLQSLARQRRRDGDALEDEDIISEEEVRVEMRLTLSTEEGVLQGSGVGSVRARSTAEQLALWWREAAGDCPAAPMVEGSQQRPTAPLRLAQPSQSRAPMSNGDSQSRAQSSHVYRPSAPLSETQHERQSASTYEVPSPVPRQRMGQQPAHVPHGYASPPWAHNASYRQLYPAAGSSFASAPTQPSPPPPPSVVTVRAQPNVPRERAGQNGIAWIIR